MNNRNECEHINKNTVLSQKWVKWTKKMNLYTGNIVRWLNGQYGEITDINLDTNEITVTWEDGMVDTYTEDDSHAILVVYQTKDVYELAMQQLAIHQETIYYHNTKAHNLLPQVQDAQRNMDEKHRIYQASQANDDHYAYVRALEQYHIVYTNLQTHLHHVDSAKASINDIYKQELMTSLQTKKGECPIPKIEHYTYK